MHGPGQLNTGRSWEYDAVMRVLLQHPKRETEIKGPRTVGQLLKRLELLPEAVLVIRGDDLITEDEALKEDDTVEIRPVISGGA
jgi:sulfur carrier protein